jgi:murein DD-endopeptidase MepM/ murein hydrolase activator NlpD
MEYQIILLPREDYWSWVRACRDYVMQYGVNLTKDPGTAGRYMFPAQVVTLPRAPEAYPLEGDIEEWLQAQFPGVRLDIIEASEPKQLEKELRQRVDEQDRYGQKRKPFYLLWPTDFPVITQPFGANPQIYSRFGVPAHEGLDIRAFSKSNIYCCADGEVFEVHTNPRDHPYGIHVRIRHKDGYKTVYAHLAQPLVHVGEAVKAGQVIGLADSTGASTGSHLHLTLKRDGATERKETNFPKDILDPTPYMVWPEGSYRKSIEALSWAAGRCLIGAHGRVDGPLTDEDLEIVKLAKLEAVKLGLMDTDETVQALREIRPGMLIMVRASADFSREPLDAEQFVAQIETDLGRFYELGVREVELHANPNLQFAGWNRTWQDGHEFAEWFVKVLGSLKKRFPEFRFGFPGLAPGPGIPGWQEDANLFLEQAGQAVFDADWIGVHCQWRDTFGLNALDGGRTYEAYRHRYPGKMFFITEFYNPVSTVPPESKAQQYLAYYNQLRHEPGIGAAFALALSAEHGFEPMVWRKEGSPESAIAVMIGERED